MCVHVNKSNKVSQIKQDFTEQNRWRSVFYLNCVFYIINFYSLQSVFMHAFLPNFWSFAALSTSAPVGGEMARVHDHARGAKIHTVA